MTKHGAHELLWKEDNLYYKGEVVYSVVRDKKFEGMYRMKSIKGRKSKDFYNLTRARDNSVHLALKALNADPATRIEVSTEPRA